MKFTVDTREPWPHPWAPFFSPDVSLSRGTMDTGDLAVSALPDGAVVERKAPGDFLACVGRERERFERELLRSRYCGAFVIIVEAGFPDVLTLARQHGGGLSDNAIVGSVAAWTRRGAPVLFCGSVRLAAELAERFLRGQVREVQRTS